MVRSSPAKTIEEARRDLRRRGAITTFICRPVSHVECQACGVESDATPDMLSAMHRVVGPDEDAVVALLQCPSCHSLGTVVVGSGPAVPEEDAGVLAALLDEGSPFISHG